MGWIKRPKPGPIDLGTRHLDSVVTPDLYTQRYTSRSTKANGYPFEGKAGVLEVLPWIADTGVIQRWTSQAGGIATRYYLNGSWQRWMDATGTAVA